MYCAGDHWKPHVCPASELLRIDPPRVAAQALVASAAAMVVQSPCCSGFWKKKSGHGGGLACEAWATAGIISRAAVRRVSAMRVNFFMIQFSLTRRAPVGSVEETISFFHAEQAERD